MDYRESLEYIGSRLRFGIKPGLERTISLLNKTGEPQRKLRFVHVAGTNGKGSVCAMISSALIKAGFKTGLYTSPYITDFRERMQINGEMISEGDLARLTGYVREIMERDPESLSEVTEFELITVIALLWFAESGCDIVVLETGLGGRLDSTNVIEAPECAVITRIDYDHTAVLGGTIEKIASEKAGIIKPGCPVVLAPGQPEDAERVITRTAERLGCGLIKPRPEQIGIKSVSIDGTRMTYGGLDIDLPLAGEHQVSNCVTAVEALRVLGVPDNAIMPGIAAARIPARLELLGREPVVILDGAHNPNGAAALASAIERLLAGKRIIGVTGMLADKDCEGEIELLGGCFERVFCCGGFSERCMPAGELARRFSARGVNAESADPPETAFLRALEAARSAPGGSGAVVVFGSLYLAGRLRHFIIDTLKNG